MQANDHELLLFRVSSAPYEKSGELNAFREAYGRTILRFDIGALDGHPLQFDFVLRSLPDLAVASGSRSPMHIWRSEELIDNDDIILVVVTRGAGELGQHGRVAAMHDGGAALMENGAPASFLVPTSSHTITYRFRRNLLRPHIPNLDDLLIRPIAGGSQALRLLVGYSRVLNDQSALATAELRRTVTTHMHDLAVLLLGGKAEAPLAGGLRAARLKAMKDDILQRIARSSFSVGEIARSHQISERYIRKLFAEEGTSFTDFVRQARLARAHQMLTDPSQRFRPINAIAYENGFSDLSYFNRAFRQRYGMTPSEAREMARQKD
ncbi:AraC family transcriptional regulator [Bradyrhizobium manausense]|uniref:helix-turn-helix transcriptional regulator n=1 Tax=Bradyrhizobium manausense TaxID=989370 RepID=UPI001BABA75B|nr:AraC family transcriptional regulator [Bradyrhizobium manausense]